nr:MAG TPA: hypothetical protein [Caudoviricetes sp.]
MRRTPESSFNSEFGILNSEFRCPLSRTYSDRIEFKSVPRSGTHSFRIHNSEFRI